MYAYFDWAATSPLCPAARDAMQPWLGMRYGNPSSLHRYGKAARLALEEARHQVAALMGADSAEVVFTSGATEADNLAVRGAAWAMREDRGARHVVVSAIEHPAVLRAAQWLEREGFEVDTVAVDTSGVLATRDVHRILRADSAVVSVMAVNNEVGTLQDVAEIAALAHEVGALFHCDAVQAAACQHVDVHRWGVDLLSLSSHKIGGPPGAGALFVRRGVTLRPLLVGGEQENQRRAGTENLPALVGFGAAAAALSEELEARVKSMTRIGRMLHEGLQQGVPGLQCVADPASRAPHIACYLFEGVDAETLLFALDMEGVAVSSGSACSSHTIEPSPVLLAMGFGVARARSAIRFSWGPTTTEAEVRHLLDVLPPLVERNRLAQRQGAAL